MRATVCAPPVLPAPAGTAEESPLSSEEAGSSTGNCRYGMLHALFPGSRMQFHSISCHCCFGIRRIAVLPSTHIQHNSFRKKLPSHATPPFSLILSCKCYTRYQPKVAVSCSLTTSSFHQAFCTASIRSVCKTANSFPTASKSNRRLSCVSSSWSFTSRSRRAASAI